jgi:hypothetical protein
MRIRLCSYLYIVLLMLISSSSFALTPEQSSYGGFAEVTVCSHPTDINFCVPIKDPDAQKMACTIWLGHIQVGQSSAANPIQWTFKGIQNNYCMYDGLQANTGYKNSNSQALTTRSGFCPQQDAPPPEPITFSRMGRWYAGEAAGTRCFKRCEYRTNANTFKVTYYQFTNGFVTQFVESSERAKSNEKLCFSEAEPARNDKNEVYDDASCDAKLFSVFCDFIKWYRTDSEMPTAPEVENKTLQIDTSLKTDHVVVNPQSTADFLCFNPVTFDLYLPFAQKQIKQEITFSKMCNSLREISFFFHTLYLLHAAFIIFRK